MNLPHFQPGNIDVAETKRLLAQSGKYVTFHLDENLSVCDFNLLVANAYLETVRQTIALAKGLSASIINMHLSDGVYFTLPEGKVFLFEQNSEKYFTDLQRFRDICDEEIGDSDILICIENCGKYHDFQRKAIELLIESPKFALTFDIGHDYLASDAIADFITAHADRLRHMHLHDATRQANHLTLGTGEADIVSKLKLAETHNCRCVIEVKTPEGLRQSVDWIRENYFVPSEEIAGTKVANASPNVEKVALFQSLFRGRTDTYARRWESKDGQKAGYSPACENEWVRFVCGKPKMKCTDCKNRALIQLDESAMTRHLSGREVVGVYPMLPDETCLFLATDFDGDGWQKDAAAFRDICKQSNVPIAVERSRSGNGAHAWMFFNEPIAASTARRLGTALLTLAMNNRHEIKFSSYDRFFPNQDTMPKGGFGNLIALPLQRIPRDNGNSVFIDESFRQYMDQWAYLSGLRKLSQSEVESLVSKLCKGGDLGVLHSDEDDEKPWQRKLPDAQISALDFPPEVPIVMTNMLYIRKEGISARALNRLKRLAAFKNPEFFKAQAMRFPTWDKPRVISIADETEKYLCLPRGCKSDVENLLSECGATVTWMDERNAGNLINVTFNGTLRDEQAAAQAALLAHDIGILSATTAFGKTVVAASLIAERKVNTLVLVNRRPLLDQWKTRLGDFLNINETLPEPEKKRGRKKERSVIGQFGGGKDDVHSIVDIAVIQSLVRGDEVSEIVKNYGMVIVDECHHVSAVSFERVLKAANAKFVYGLTATPKRQDGHHPIITMHCGEIRYRDDAKLQAIKRPFEHYIIPRFTSYRLPIEKDNPMIQEIYADICQNEPRNTMIVDDVTKAVAEGRNPLVLTERTAHVDLLAKALSEKLDNIIVLVGGQSAKERRRLLEQIGAVPPGKPLVIVATGKYVGEGFDVPRLDTLFLAMPIAWQGTLAQYAGRLHRLHDAKTEVLVYDYIDIRVPVLDRMYQKRVKGYTAIGYKAKYEGQVPESGDILYDGTNFLSVYENDLRLAKREVLVVSPFLSKSRISKMLPALEIASKSGASITVYTRPASDYPEKDVGRIEGLINMLKAKSIAIVERSKIHQKYAVVDGRVVWYGSINLLSFGSAEESIMRLESVVIAGELSAVLKF